MRWRAAGWLSAHLPEVRGHDRIVGMVRGPSRLCGKAHGQLVNGLVFDFDQTTDGSLHSLIFLQYAKPALAPVFEHFAQPGRVIYDVGANVGIYSLWAANGVGRTGEVHAFEPVASTAALLRRFIAANGVSQVQVSEVAVSAKRGAVSLFCMPNASGRASMTAQQGTVAIDVATTTLDAYAVNHRPPSFIKVDVEGHEHEVLAGAVSLLASHRPALLLEVMQTAHSDGPAGNIVRDLRQIGYEVFDLTRHGLRVSKWPSSQNVLALDLDLIGHKDAFVELRATPFPRNQTT